MTRLHAGKGRSRSDRNRPGASRARTNRSRPNRARPGSPAKTPFPWRIALLLVALLCLFGYVLISIQGASQDPSLDSGSSEPVSPPVDTPAKPAEPLPQAPTERWG